LADAAKPDSTTKTRRKTPGSAARKRAGTDSAAGKAAPRTRAAAGANDEAADKSALPLARELRWWADSMLGLASSAADLSMNVARMTLRKPSQRAALERAGAMLKGFRESAGLSLREVGAAIDLKDPALLEAAEGGKISLPFEVILRLAAVLGRKDPISFVMKLTRTQSPDLWATLESLGVGKLVVQAGREREFANIYRADDRARRLSDAEFAKVLKFVQAAFDLAITLREAHGTRSAGKAAGAAPAEQDPSIE
jgi:transcriptional regulator with XRE-family HTH domain